MRKKNASCCWVRDLIVAPANPDNCVRGCARTQENAELRSVERNGAMLKVYGFSKVNAVARGNTRDLRVLWALEEMQLPFEIVGMDHPAHDLNTDAYRQLSPFEQIPAIDDDGVVLSESAAILLYLAKKARRLIPPDAAGEAQVVRWCFAALNTVEPPMLSLMVLDWVADGSTGNYREFLAGWVKRVRTNLERWFENREYVATGEFTVADILMTHVLSVGPKAEEALGPYPALAAYRQRCLARPAWKRTIEAYNARVVAG
jgi:glutathione S-transferase